MLILKKNKEKVFCIGLNKTGTTTVEKVFEEFNYKIGNQNKAELLLNNWFNRDFKEIINYCKTAEAFQDVPFSFPHTYIALDQVFKNSKFILTVRDNPEQWYKSLTLFHSKLWADGVNAPTIEQLKNAKYCYKGFAYDVNRYLFNTPEDNPYDKKELLDFYQNYNRQVIDYFKSKPEKFIKINVSKKEDYKRLCNFLDKTPKRDNFPWENKTSENK